MDGFHYEWWTVDIIFTTGKVSTEFKGKSREHVMKQIGRWVANTNRRHNDESLPWWERGDGVNEVLWDTLKLDRIGYKRLS